jgi:hypothetical protein
MIRYFAIDRTSAARVIIARLLVVFLALQAFIPGVLAYSAANDSLWCRSMAAAVPGSTLPAAGPEPCLVCIVMSAGNTPLPAALPVLPAPKAAAAAAKFKAVVQNAPAAPNDRAAPIRGPPPFAVIHAGTRPACHAEGCALT